MHFDPWREAWQRQLVLCPSWEWAPQHPSLCSWWDRGWECVGQDEASALGCLQPAAAPRGWALRSQAGCDHCGDRFTPQPAAPDPSGHLQLPSQCICRVPPAPVPREQSSQLLELGVQCAPQCPARGPACGGLLHDEASHAGISRRTGRGVCRCSAGHRHIQPARSQVRASQGSCCFLLAMEHGSAVVRGVLGAMPAGYLTQVRAASDPRRVRHAEEVQQQHRGGTVRLPARG